jgi:crotonobetainyl-CoA:carnitine CoA-transferase CaiB-like acyl-CoA transferase
VSETNQAIRPLEGLTVVEIAQGVPGSYAGRLFAVMGATVIKLEPPGGAALRRDPPHVGGGVPEGALFHYLNVNKQAATCELPGDAARFERLLARADVLIDDTPVAERAALGLDPEVLARRHPRLVHLSVLPFGAFGRHAGCRAYEINVLHAGGEGYLMPNGLTLEMFPDRPPVKIYGHFAEMVGGTSAVCAALAALIAPGDEGQFVDVSVQDANVAIGCFAIQRLGDGVLETRHNRSFKYGGVIECADGHVQVLTLEEHQWQGLVKLMDSPAWALVPEFRDSLERGRRGAEINRGLRAWAKTQKVADVVARGQALDVPIAPYYEPGALLAAPQARARGLFAPASFPGAANTVMLTAPFRFSAQPLPVVRTFPAPGADNATVWGATPAGA